MTRTNIQTAKEEAQNEWAPVQQQDAHKTIIPSALTTITAELAALFLEGPLTNDELYAIRSMIAYAAYTQGVTQELVEVVLAMAFSIQEVRALPREYYDDAIRFLLDFRFEKAIN